MITEIMARFGKPLLHHRAVYLIPFSPPHILRAWATSQQCTQHIADGFDGFVGELLVMQTKEEERDQLHP